jgi:hypothetical protein
MAAQLTKRFRSNDYADALCLGAPFIRDGLAAAGYSSATVIGLRKRQLSSLR